MYVSKKIVNSKESFDIDLQLIATELDASAKSLKYLSNSLMEDAIAIEAFEKMCDDIENISGIEVTNFDDNTILYEYLEEPVIIHNVLGIKYLIFDSVNTQKLEFKLNSYR